MKIWGILLIFIHFTAYASQCSDNFKLYKPLQKVWLLEDLEVLFIRKFNKSHEKYFNDTRVIEFFKKKKEFNLFLVNPQQNPKFVASVKKTSEELREEMGNRFLFYPKLNWNYSLFVTKDVPYETLIHETKHIDDFIAIGDALALARNHYTLYKDQRELMDTVITYIYEFRAYREVYEYYLSNGMLEQADKYFHKFMSHYENKTHEALFLMKMNNPDLLKRARILIHHHCNGLGKFNNSIILPEFF
jgi:hypothetical protein